MRQLVGEHNCGSFSTRTFKNDNALTELLDKRVSICDDDNGHLEDVGLFNRVVSNEPIQAKRLYQNSFSTRLNTFLVRAYNNHITTPTNSVGLNRRIVAMSFSNRPERPDWSLGEKIRSELPGIFNWAWELSVEQMEQRIASAGNISAVAVASIDRFRANNPIFVFLEETYPNGGQVKMRDLHRQYMDWSKDTGRLPANQRVFTDAIVRFGCTKIRAQDNQTPYLIPAMKDFDIIQLLGIGRDCRKEVADVNTENSPNLGEILERKTANFPPDFGVSPSQKQDLVNNTSDDTPSGEKVEAFDKTFFSEDFNGEKEVTNLDLAPDSSTEIEPPTEPIAVVESTASLLDSQEYEVSFSKLKTAKQWIEFMEVKFSCYGILNKYRKQLPTTPSVPHHQYYVYFQKASPEAIAFLEQSNLLFAPPARQ
jgi:phage/plasmid-associated DNA primase